MLDEKQWSLGIGFVNTWSRESRIIGLIPNIEYIQNPFNVGFDITFFGIGVFFGFINKKLLMQQKEE